MVRLSRTTYYVVNPPQKRKKYGLLGFLGDCIMTIVTGGLWLIWIFVREMRNR